MDDWQYGQYEDVEEKSRGEMNLALTTEWIRYGEGQQYSGYLAIQERARKPLPAVIVIQEIWGVDEHIQDVTRRFAQAGYAAFAPDLFSVNGDRPVPLQADRVETIKQFLESLPPAAWHDAKERENALSRLPGDEGQKISETFGILFGGLTPDKYLGQLRDTVDFLRRDSSFAQGRPVLSVGFCMGGALSMRLAGAHPELGGAVVFYGAAASKDELRNIACPVRGFYGGLDQRITDGVPALVSDMKEMGKDFQPVVYAGANHAFFNDSRSSYHVGAARDAFAQALMFFNQVVS